MKRGRETEERSSVKRPRICATPYTPYPLQPSDSPSNPFKRIPTVDSLPPISSFRKHIPLRFQFYRPRVGFHKGGVHRIVQVPLNYTFTHLRALIAWLFDVPPKCTNGKVGDEDCLFEVKSDVTMEAARSRPGMIRCGETSVKLSNSWRRRYSDHDELEGEDDELSDNLDGDWIWADEEDYSLGHVWATGLQADKAIIYHHCPSTQVHITVNTTKLPRRRGKSNIPYVFLARGRVHLSRPLPRPLFTQSILHTLSSSPVGPSSLHLYTTRTRTSLDQKPSLPSLFTPTNNDSESDQHGSPSKSFDRNRQPFDLSSPIVSRLEARIRKDPPIILVDDSDEDEDKDDLDEAHDRHIDPDHWNESYYAFGRYLLSFLDPRGRSYAHLDDEYFEEKKPYDPFENDEDEEVVIEEAYVEEGSMNQYDELEGEGEKSSTGGSTPGLTTSSTRCGSSLPPSSPPVLHYSVTLDGDKDNDPSSIDPLSLSPNSSLELHPSIIASHYPNRKYTFTPAPPIARTHRLQLVRLERRLERGKRGTYLCEYDEIVDEDDEVDELLDEEEERMDGEIWDPFGDEPEV